jgi:hypothetical protein
LNYNFKDLELLLNELKRCFIALEVTDEMPKDACAADMVHLINEYLNKGNLNV